MSFELIVPEMSEKGTCKDLIIKVLTENWPLTLKEIFSHLKKQFKYPGSYQSVFKSVNELLDKKVIIRKDKEYELNISWVKKLQSFTDIVETNYYADKTKKKAVSHEKQDTKILNFTNLFDAEKYLYYFVKAELKKLKNKRVVYELAHFWKVLFYYRAEYNYYTKLMKLGHKFYFFYSGKSKIEDEAIKFYKKLGIKLKRKKGEIEIDSIIFDKYFIQIFIPEGLKKKMKKYINEGKDFLLLKTLDEDYPVKVIIHEDVSLAENLVREHLKKL